MAKVTTLPIYVKTFKGHLLYNGKYSLNFVYNLKISNPKNMFKWRPCTNLGLPYGKDILVLYVSIWEIVLIVDFSETIEYKVVVYPVYD